MNGRILSVRERRHRFSTPVYRFRSASTRAYLRSTNAALNAAHHCGVVCMAELFSVSSASLPGRTAIAMARQNWQNRIG
jgi:hypothetical protein